MNHREPPQPAAGVRKATLCLALLTLTVLAPTGALASARKTTPPKADPNSYLAAIAAPALRFQAPPPPRAEITRLALAFPSSGKPTFIPSALPRTSDVTGRPATATVAVAKEGAAKVEEEKAPPPPMLERNPALIIPDELRPQVHAEDFIPFFQLPGSSRGRGDVNVVVPAPRSVPAPPPLPPSSATYRQTP